MSAKVSFTRVLPTHLWAAKTKCSNRFPNRPESAVGADVAHDVVVGDRFVHGDERFQAARIRPEIERLLRRRGIHARTLPARRHQRAADYDKHFPWHEM